MRQLSAIHSPANRRDDASAAGRSILLLGLVFVVVASALFAVRSLAAAPRHAPPHTPPPAATVHATAPVVAIDAKLRAPGDGAPWVRWTYIP